jgi:hypothetical protein
MRPTHVALLLVCALAAVQAWGPLDIQTVHVIFSNHLDVGMAEVGFAAAATVRSALILCAVRGPQASTALIRRSALRIT